MKRPEVISMGNMLVEVMRIHTDEPMDRPGTFAGPFPSGDTPIYIDAVAKLGHSAGFIGCVGDDDFGRCILDRFNRDGVDTTCVRILPDHTTGVAFVAYFGDGSRRFIYHWRHAAAGQLTRDQLIHEYFSECKWLHITGCNLAVNESSRDACYHALELISEQVVVSFDPNVRPEVLSASEICDLCAPVLARANIFLPSIGEAAMFAGTPSDEAGCQFFAQQGKLVVLKKGAGGCTLYRSDEMIHVDGFSVPEVDPTGAGDCFCAGITVAFLEGMSLPNAGRFANAVGALAVTQKGPMEGSPDRMAADELANPRSDFA